MTQHEVDDDGQRPTKRGKPSSAKGCEDQEEETRDVVAVALADVEAIERAWEHYRNFIDGDDDDDDDDDEDDENENENDDENNGDDRGKSGGDIDELLELIEILDPSSSSSPSSSMSTIPPLSSSSSSSSSSDDVDFVLGDGASAKETLLSILLSMSHVHLASHAVSEAMTTGARGGESSSSLSSSSPEYHFRRSLHHWPTNPVAHSLLANYNRMNRSSTLESVCETYGRAASYANRWRRSALDFLRRSSEEEEETENDGAAVEGGIDVNEWVELLILNGALDVEYVGKDDDDDDDDDDENVDGDAYSSYSSSGVEATASFMSAFLLSTLSRHDEALAHLRGFRLSHRVHPNVWTMAGGARPPPSSSHDDRHRIVRGGGDCAQRSPSSPPPSFSSDFLPRIYCGWRSDDDGVDGGGVLPPELHRRLCALFKPDAPYWKESDYDNRGYYSYFLGLNDDVVDDASTSVGSNERSPTNVVEDVIFKHLLPLVERSLRENKVGISSSSPPRIVGAEWWVHTRPVGANLGHQVHFDTDESLLNRERRVTHPIVSSVLYLTGAGRDREVGGDSAPPAVAAGSTVVFNQTPESTDVASRAWVSHPRDNAFMVFPGNLLHGVLPCTAAESLEVSDTAAAAARGKVGCVDHDKEEDVRRLTFMVGFWTRDVREGMGERELYTPCGPMPPPVSEHSWVMQARRGYCENKTKRKSNDDKNGTKAEQRGGTLMFNVLPSTFPAWEEFSSNGNSALTIPKGLDHRFFVLNAPHCFSEGLYEKGDLF